MDVEREAITWWPEGWRWRPFTICILRSSHPGWNGLRHILDGGPIYRVIGEWPASAGAAPLVAAHEPEAILLPDGLPQLPAPALIAALRDHGVSGKMVVAGERPHHDPLMALARQGSDGYLCWNQVSPRVVFCTLMGVLQADLKVGTAQALEALALEPEAERRHQVEALHLTERELKTLHWLGEDLTEEAVAERIGMGRRVVERMVPQLEDKLKVSSLSELRVKARDLEL